MENIHKKPWWHRYRHVKNRPRQQISLEMIVRKSFSDVLSEYVQHCSLAGIQLACERDIPIKRRIFWSIVIGATYVAVVYMLMNVWSATLSTPLIVTMDSSTFPIAEIDFPAIAVCNINRLSRKAVMERAVEIVYWLSSVIHNTGTTLMNVWSATLSTPLIVTMDSATFPMAEIDFPAVAVCNINRLSRKAMMERAVEIFNNSKSYSNLNDVVWYLLQGGRLLDYSYNETLRLRLLKYQHISDEASKGIVNTMKRLAPDCDEMLVRCSWAGEVIPCSDIFTIRRTAHGHCCAFNYVLEYNSMDRPSKTENLINNVMRQRQAGLAHGLIMVLDPLLDDYAYPLRNMQGFDIFLFDPTHFADPNGGRVIQRIAEPNEVMVLELQSVKQIATAEVRKYPISTRKCLFHDEVPEHYGEMYSYSACVARCRIKTIRSLCKCTPYFLPKSRDTSPICSLVDLQCLNKYREKLLYMYPFHASSTDGLGIEFLDSLYCPECLPNCELTKHSTKSIVVPFRDQVINNLSLIPLLADDLNIFDSSNLSMVYIYQPTNDGVLDRLDVVFYWYEILSNIGGFAGILVGLSIISVVEIIYYFVRFIHVLCKNVLAYH